MTVDYSAARDEMFALFKTAWDASSSTVAGYVPEVRYQGRELPTKPSATKHWCRISTQNVIDRQITLSDCVEESGKKRYESAGLVFVQLFAPKSVATADEQGRKLAEVAKKAFRGKTTPGAIWFKNVRINDNIADEDGFYRFNVVAEYEYDEVG